MKIVNRPHPLKLKNWLQIATLMLLMSGIAWLSQRYPAVIDISANGSNTLSIESQKLLTQLTEPVQITAYIPKGQPIRKQISQLIQRYRDHKPDLELSFVDPASSPETVRRYHIGKEGAVLVTYQKRTEKITFLSETSLSNTLLQLAYSQQHWISFLTGHGERDALGVANFDLSDFSSQLTHHQQQAQPLDLTNLTEIPGNSALLVIANPRVNLLDAELKILHQYLEQGGNLLLLVEPNQTTLDPILTDLGLTRLPGLLLDQQSKLYHIDNPSFIVMNSYPTPHAITQNLETMTLFPETAAFTLNPHTDYQSVPFLLSSAESWNETEPLTNSAPIQEQQLNEYSGPLPFGLALTRQHAGKQQRIVVIGDGDFLSNTYLGNVGNVELGIRIVKWLVHDDHYLNIPARLTPDRSLNLSPITMGSIGFGFLLIIPMCLIICGLWIWRKRRRR